MKRFPDGPGPQGPPPKRFGKGGPDVGVPRARHAFKVLCTDGLVAGLLGTRGSVKDEIQQATGVRLVFSNRGDYFPHTHYRVLGIYADESPAIQRAFEWVVPRLVDLGEEERRGPAHHAPELLGKEPGEYVFRFAVSRRMSSQIIGRGGDNIKKIRDETGAKVFLENDTYLGHRMGRVIGQPDAILAALEHINGHVQHEANDEDYHSNFAVVINFSEAAAAGWAPPLEPHDGPGPHSPTSTTRGRGGLPLAREEADGIVEVLTGFPPGAARLQYSVSSDVPAAHLPALLGKSGEHIKYVEQVTGTSVSISRTSDPVRPMTIVGPLFNVYTAHAMMMQRLRSSEAEEARQRSRVASSAGPDDPELLKAKIAELQEQLARAQGHSLAA